LWKKTSVSCPQKTGSQKNKILISFQKRQYCNHNAAKDLILNQLIILKKLKETHKTRPWHFWLSIKNMLIESIDRLQ